ncbi:hypothetical protein ACP275_02G076100 [Erythranthe tilingii]
MAIVTGAWYLASARLPVHLRYRAVVPPAFSFVCVYSMWAYFAFEKMRRAGYHMRVHIWRRTVVARVIGSLTEEFDRTVGVQLDPLFPSTVRLPKARARVADMAEEINAALQLPSPSTKFHMFDLIITSVIALLFIVFVVCSTCGTVFFFFLIIAINFQSLHCCCFRYIF